jgi:hypothetical protein
MSTEEDDLGTRSVVVYLVFICFIFQIFPNGSDTIVVLSLLNMCGVTGFPVTIV